MIVEDDHVLRHIHTAYLSNKGYEVVSCESAVEIIADIAKYTPDLIIMDHKMPVVLGLDAIKQIKSHYLYKAIPIIYFSSVSNLEELAIESKADRFLRKSGDLEPLYSMIQTTISVRN